MDRWTRPSSPASSDLGRPAASHLPATPAVVAFEEFFETERRRLFRAIYLMTGSIHDAEELTQDAFLTVWARWERVRRMDSPTGYLYRTAMNAYRSRHRRLARLAKRSLVPSPAEDPFEAADLKDSIVRALRGIAPRQRAALILTELLDYDSEEAGRLLGVKAVTVRNLASQGRAQLKRSIGHTMGEYRSLLEQIGERISMPEPAFERLRRRRDRKSRIDRAVAVSVALVLSAAATVVVVRAFEASDRLRPTSLGPETVSELDLAWVGVLGQPEAEFGSGVATASSPVVADGVVYVGSADRRLYAFEAGCGQGGETCDPLWTATTSDRIASTPAVSEGDVYVASQDGGLYAFPTECSSPCEPLWTASMGGYVRRGSPVVAGGVVYMMSQRTVGQQRPNDPTSLYAFPAECGTVGAFCEALWRAFEGRVSYSTPSVHDGLVYAPMGDGVYVFPADCGSKGNVCRPLWRTLGFAPLFASVAIAADRVFIADGDRLAALPSRCEGARCRPAWVSRSPGTVYSALVATDRMVFVGTTSFPEPGNPANTVPALLAFQADCVPPSPTGGCEPGWRGTGMEGFVEAPPTAAEGLVFLAMNSSDLESGTLYAFDQDCGRDGEPCEPLWSEPIDGTTGLSSPAIADSVVYLSAGGKLLAFDLRSEQPPSQTWLPIVIVLVIVLTAAIWLRRRMTS